MNQTSVTIAGRNVKVPKFQKKEKVLIQDYFLKFIDTASTSTDRSTAYNTKEEQRKTTETIHDNLFESNRGLYTASLLLDGITDYNIVTGIQKLLTNKSNRENSFLDIETESIAIAYMLMNMPPQRMLKMYLELRKNHTNNSRTKRIILTSLLNASSLDFWAIKYRKKIRLSIEHALGKRTSSIVISILKRQQKNWDSKEQSIIDKNINKYILNSSKKEKIYEILLFIFGNIDNISKSPLIKSYIESRVDINKGINLPTEVLEGIRSTYHKETYTKDDILKLTAKNLTSKEKMKVQSRAKKAGISVDWNPSKQKAIDLYIHAFENGMTDEIKNALLIKAKQSAKGVPFAYSKIGILVDASSSSFGNDTQKLRPMAINLTIRDMLKETADDIDIQYAGGYETNGLIRPMGETNLAKYLVKLVEKNPEAIFILSDGYENAPAGRVNEVMEALKNIGFNIPVYQFNPVMSAEVGGVKTLSNLISTIPVNSPESIGLGIIRSVLTTDFNNGILGLFKLTLPKLINRNSK